MAQGNSAEVAQGNSAEKERWLAIGRLEGAFGVRGEIRIRPLTDVPEAILNCPPCCLGRHETKLQESEILSARPHSRGFLVQMKGVDNREAARALSGTFLWIKRSDLPDPGTDSDYWDDLIGCRVQTESGEEIGSVHHLLETGANDVLVVRSPGKPEKLIPYTQEVVQEVDTENKRLTVRLLPGM
ncbi:MAG: 16S rRNA processing protein RimM [Magnetococcales bacterium]|nr:16S rRNA processing protein RimM [Magnetococcales bacterium]